MKISFKTSNVHTYLCLFLINHSLFPPKFKFSKRISVTVWPYLISQILLLDKEIHFR